MATITLTIPFDVDDDDIATMIDTNVYPRTSPWVGGITRYTDSGTRRDYWLVRYDGPTDNEGSWDRKKRINTSDLLNAFGVAYKDQAEGRHHGLCCVDEMIAGRSLGIGCAQDTDVILQYAVLGELVYSP